MIELFGRLLCSALCFAKPWVAVGILLLVGSCGKEFVVGDVSNVIESKSASYLADSSTGYSVYGGYGSSCEQSAAQAEFGIGDHQLYAVLDGTVADITDCDSNGGNARFEIRLLIGYSGAVPVFFVYSVEPMTEQGCSTGLFSSSIGVREGDTVKQRDPIGTLRAVDSGARVHFYLEADGARLCPDIFPSSVFSGAAGAKTGCPAAPANTFCYQLTHSENVSRLR